MRFRKSRVNERLLCPIISATKNLMDKKIGIRPAVVFQCKKKREH